MEQPGSALLSGVGRGNLDLTSADFHSNPWLRLRPHREQLEDPQWARCWEEALTPDELKGKVVLDLHSGVGYRTLLAARAGAAAVYAVEPTWLAEVCTQVVTDNGFDRVVTVIQKDVGRWLVLPTATVDVILCSWVGPAGLYDSLIASVIWARDRFLTASGIVLPNRAVVHMCGASQPHVSDGAELSWEDVYGFDMSAIRPRKQPSRIVATTDYTTLTYTERVHDLDVMECSIRDASYIRSTALRSLTDDAQIEGVVASVTTHFDHCVTKPQLESGGAGSIGNVFFPLQMRNILDSSLTVRCVYCSPTKPSEHSSCEISLAFQSKGGAT